MCYCFLILNQESQEASPKQLEERAKRRYGIGCTVLATCEEHVAMHDVGSGGVEWTLKKKQLALRKMG